MMKIKEVSMDATKVAAIRNLMDNEIAEQVAFDKQPETEEEFILEYLKLDPDFEVVLSSEFGVEV